MTSSILKYISDRMHAIGIPYSFARWDGPIASESTYYIVGEYTEVKTMGREEEGRQETTLILRGFTRGTWLLLEEAKAKIEKEIPCTTILDDGTGVAIMYDSGMIVPTGNADLKSIKINLTIQEWRADL